MTARVWTRRYARRATTTPRSNSRSIGRKPVNVVFEVDPGPRYRLRDVAIEVSPPETDLPLPSVAELGIAPGTPAVAQTILNAETRLVELAKARGYALAEAGERRAVVDHDADAMDLTLTLNAGPPVRFGEIEVSGLDQVQPDFVERRLPWRPGELITAERLEAGQRALREANLFNTIAVRLGENPDATGRVPVTVVVTERNTARSKPACAIRPTRVRAAISPGSIATSSAAASRSGPSSTSPPSPAFSPAASANRMSGYEILR